MTLGKLIDSPQERDAVHVAIVPLIAGESLRPGQKFRLKLGTNNIALNGIYGIAIGIVDPFLEELYVKKDKQFWGLLFPDTVTGMRHQWEHPAFDKIEKTTNEHKLWLCEFCDRWGFDLDELIEAGTTPGEYVVAHGRDLHSVAELEEGEEELFWYHLESLLGEHFSVEHRRSIGWSCSC